MKRGAGLVELLAAMLLATVVLGAATRAIGIGGRLHGLLGRRGEVEDTLQLAVEALVFDVRRAGYDPRAIGVEALAEADVDRVTLAADLDADGAVDVSSEERTAWVCNAGARRLSRIIGAQSLPLADATTRCGFQYLDASGGVVPVPPGGLDPATRARVRAIRLDLELAPTGLARPARGSMTVALRRDP